MPPHPVPGSATWKYRPGVRAPPLHLDPGIGNIEQLAGLMFRENAGDMVIHHHDLIDLAMPLLGEHADGRRAAAHPHALFGHSVDDGGIAGLYDDGSAAVDGQFHRLAVGEVHQRVAGDAAFLLGAAGQMMHAAEGQHLRAVFAGRHVPDRLAFRTDDCSLGSEIAVSVDLHLDAAIAENPFGHDRDHVDAVDFRGHDEGCRLVIGISCSRADGGDEHAGFMHELAVPIAAGLEWHQPPTMRYRSLQHDVRIDTHQLAVVIGITIARACRARLDVAHHRTSIAADLVATGDGRIGHEQACSREGADRSRLFAVRSLCSYTNDVARGLERCQAGPEAKSLACRIIAHLPRIPVHKASNALQRGWRACTFVHKRYLSPASRAGFCSAART